MARNKSRCSHRKRARAARISSLLSRKEPAFPKLMPGELFNTSGIDRHLIRDTIPQVSSWRRSNRVDASYEKTDGTLLGKRSSAARTPGSSWAMMSRPAAAVAGETRRG